MQVDNRLGKDYKIYVEKIKKLLKFIVDIIDWHGHIRYPCHNCKNLHSQKIELVSEHLFVKGIENDYTNRVLHSESYPTSFEPPLEEEVIDENIDPKAVGDEVDEDMK